MHFYAKKVRVERVLYNSVVNLSVEALPIL